MPIISLRNGLIVGAFSLLALAVVAGPFILKSSQTVTVVGYPPLTYPDFQTWPTPRDFDGPGTLFVLENGYFDYRGKLDVEQEPPGDETLAAQSLSGKWRGSVLAEFIGTPPSSLAVDSGAEVAVELSLGNVQRWRASPSSLHVALLKLDRTALLGEAYVITEAISATGFRYIVTSGQNASGKLQASADVLKSTPSTRIEAQATNTGKTVIDVTYTKPHYLFYRASRIENLQGASLNLTPWISALSWLKESSPNDARRKELTAARAARVQRCIADKIKGFEVEITDKVGGGARASGPGPFGARNRDKQAICYRTRPEYKIVSVKTRNISCYGGRCSVSEPFYTEDSKRVCVTTEAWSDSKPFGGGGSAQYELIVTYRNIPQDQDIAGFRSQCESVIAPVTL